MSWVGRVAGLVLATVVTIFGLGMWLEPTRVKIDVQPRVQFSPGFFRIKVTIEPDEANRRACLVLDGTGDYHHSCWELDGAAAARTTWHELKGVGAGEYVILTVVERAIEPLVVTARTTATVEQRAGPG